MNGLTTTDWRLTHLEQRAQPAHGRSRPPGLLPLCRRQDRLPRLLAARVISSCAIGREIRSGDQPSRPHGPATTSPRSFAGPLRRRRGTQRTGACVRWRRPPGLRKSMIHRIWKAFNLQPHRTETFKLSTDPLFVEKARDIGGLLLSLPNAPHSVCRLEEPD